MDYAPLWADFAPCLEPEFCWNVHSAWPKCCWVRRSTTWPQGGRISLHPCLLWTPVPPNQVCLAARANSAAIPLPLADSGGVRWKPKSWEPLQTSFCPFGGFVLDPQWTASHPWRISASTADLRPDEWAGDIVAAYTLVFICQTLSFLDLAVLVSEFLFRHSSPWSMLMSGSPAMFFLKTLKPRLTRFWMICGFLKVIIVRSFLLLHGQLRDRALWPASLLLNDIFTNS